MKANYCKLVLALLLISSQLLPTLAFEASVVNVTAHICRPSEIRTMGYWKTHPEVYLSLLPQSLGATPTDEIIDSEGEADQVFLDYNLSMRNKLRGQLLAMKFNVAYFGIGDYIFATSADKTLNDIVADADNLLRNPDAAGSALEEMKNTLDYINNLHQIRFCGLNPPPPPPPPCTPVKIKPLDYWKDRPPAYADLLPQTLGNETIDTIQKAVSIFGLRFSLDMRKRLKPQLLTLKFNIAKFGIGNAQAEFWGGTQTLNQISADADNLLKQDPAPAQNVFEAWTNFLTFLNNREIIPCEPIIYSYPVINEVYYDGSCLGLDGRNEWIEIYNPTNEAVNISSWKIITGTGFPVIVPLSAPIPAGGFAVITPSAQTWAQWPSLPSSAVKIVSLFKFGGVLSNGLNNNGDRVILKDVGGKEIDAVSYGDDSYAFEPSVSAVSQCHSIARMPKGFDTNQASDWADLDAPNPGTNPHADSVIEPSDTTPAAAAEEPLSDLPPLSSMPSEQYTDAPSTEADSTSTATSTSEETSLLTPEPTAAEATATSAEELEAPNPPEDVPAATGEETTPPPQQTAEPAVEEPAVDLPQAEAPVIAAPPEETPPITDTAPTPTNEPPPPQPSATEPEIPPAQ